MITLPALPKAITGSSAKLPAQSIQMLVQTLRQRGQSDLGDSLEQLNQYIDALGNMVQAMRTYLQQLTTTQTGIKGEGVTSVALTVPAFLSVAGSPVTAAGTFAVTLTNETANLIFAGPVSGGAAAPAFRALGTNDFPNVATPHTVPLGPLTGGGTPGSVTFDSKGRYLSSIDPT